MNLVLDLCKCIYIHSLKLINLAGGNFFRRGQWRGLYKVAMGMSVATKIDHLAQILINNDKESYVL